LDLVALRCGFGHMGMVCWVRVRVRVSNKVSVRIRVRLWTRAKMV
jgi:hypothetical protein